MRSRVATALALPLLLTACSGAEDAPPPNAADAVQEQPGEAYMEGVPDGGTRASTDTTNSVNDPNGTELEWPNGVLVTITDVAIGPAFTAYTDQGEPDPATIDPEQVDVRVTATYRNTSSEPVAISTTDPTALSPWAEMAYGVNGESAGMLLGGALWEDEWLDDVWGATVERIAPGSEVIIGYRFAVPTDAVDALEFSIRTRFDAEAEHRWTDVQDIARTVTL